MLCFELMRISWPLIEGVGHVRSHSCRCRINRAPRPDRMTVWGYARVSTVEQNLGAQLDALIAAGVMSERIHTDTISGAKDSRPGLDAMLAALEPGDVVTVWKLDRLGRSTVHLIRLVDEWRQAGIHLRSLTDGLDTSTPMGRFIFVVMAALAELERDRTKERTALALEAARRKGTHMGRPSQVTWEQYRLVHQLAAQGESHETIRRTAGISRAVVGRVLRDEIASLAPFADRLRRQRDDDGRDSPLPEPPA